MTKLLQPHTVIPPRLYVERNADRQLNSVVQHMGRPAYVLVARQMGKTNLLLHMKREREKLGDLVFYFDLSAKSSSLRNQLRSIIDQIIDSPSINSLVLAKEIDEDRSLSSLEPAREFDRHLRLVLRSIPDARFIIVLDEVDSLTTSTYSDAFFALIRSMYFSRVNFPEYDRLTYALAGVAEPTDLIKDKAISPFNIGEKIYLDDFTRSEFEDLVEKAEIKIPDFILDQIYGWSSGNPRMSWDILSAIEDEILSGTIPTSESVDATVRKLYLARYDRAPIDHIRVLASNDPVIRNAIISIRWGKADLLDDATKSRLYLAGVISGFNGTGLCIKNRILDAALSDEWLAQVTASDVSMLDAAAREYSLKRYSATVTLIDEYTKANPGINLPIESKIQLGIALVHEGQDERAFFYLKESEEQVSSVDEAAAVNYYLSTALFRTGRTQDALLRLTKPLERGEFENVAQLTLTSVLIHRGLESDLTEALHIGDMLQSRLNDQGRELLSEEKEILASSFYNSAMALKKLQRSADAISMLEEAHSVAPPAFKPALTLAQRQIGTFKSDYASSAVQAAREILDHRLVIEARPAAALRFSEEVLINTLEALLMEGGQKDLSVELVEYSSANLAYGRQNPFSTVLRLTESSKKLSDRSVAAFAWFALDNFREEASTSGDVIAALKKIIHRNGTRLKEAWARYVAELWRDREYELDEDDFSIIFAKTIDHLKEKDNVALLRLAESILPLKKAGTSKEIFNLLLRYHRMVALQNLHRYQEARAAAEEIINASRERPLLASETDSDTRSTVEFVLKQAFDLYHAPTFDPLRNIGRNERVQVRDNRTNQELVAKFKYVEHDLRAGTLTLIKRQNASHQKHRKT